MQRNGIILRRNDSTVHLIVAAFILHYKKSYSLGKTRVPVYQTLVAPPSARMIMGRSAKPICVGLIPTLESVCRIRNRECPSAGEIQNHDELGEKRKRVNILSAIEKVAD